MNYRGLTVQILRFNVVFFLGYFSEMNYHVLTEYFVTSCVAVMLCLGGTILIHVGTPAIFFRRNRGLHCTYRRICRYQNHWCL